MIALRTVAPIVALSVALSGTPLAAQGGGGGGTIYLGTYDKKILVIDEGTLSVKDSMPVSIGIPIGMNLSADRKRIYALDAAFEKIEVFDLATRKATERFTLTTDSMKVRLSSFTVDPKERFAVLLAKTYRKKKDRFEIGGPYLLRYDLAKKAVTDTIKWPAGEEREFAFILFSPKGDLMYFFTNDDILIYDAATLKQVDRWNFDRAIDDGLRRFNFGFPESLYEEPGFYTGLFRTTDPVNNRQLMGVARVDLVNKSVDFHAYGPSEPVGFALAPGRQRAYGLRQQVGNYQFWTFDLAGHRVVTRSEFEGRPRMGLTVSSNGKYLYIHTAGATVDVYDAETLQFVRTVEYRQDMTDFILVPPGE